MTNITPLAGAMAEALSGAFPRVAISQLEPVHAVARGIIALADQRVDQGGGTTYLERYEMRIAVLAECLATWQAGTMEAALDKWLSGNPRRSVTFDGDRGSTCCVLMDEEFERFAGEGATPSLALGDAIENYDTRDPQ